MATKIRLQRHGRKGYAYYHIVVADSRAPRDGKFIELIGTYNPNTNPATIDLNFERALYWVNEAGAQPTDTTRNILSSKGVYLMKHLLGGVKKEIFSQAVADEKFNKWLQEKENKTKNLANKIANDKKSLTKARLEAEVEINKAKAEVVAKKKAEAAAKAAEAAAEAAAAEEAEAPAAETPAEETPAEA